MESKRKPLPSAPPPPSFYNGTSEYPPQQGYPAPHGPNNGPPHGYTLTQQGYSIGRVGNLGQQAAVVVQQPYPGTNVVYQSNPKDYLVPSILVCFFCFCPTGVCAIHYAIQSHSFLTQGDLPEATRTANKARNQIIASVVIGICWMIIVAVLRAAAYSNATSSNY